MNDFNHACPACGTPIDRSLELPDARILCGFARCRFSLVFGPSGWALEGASLPEAIEVALGVRARHMLAYAEATLDLVLSAPIEALERATPETARALLAFVQGTLSSLPDDSAEGRRLLRVRGALLDAAEGRACANTTE